VESGFENPLEVIDAFVDGERVDAIRFKAALAESEGRDYLVDAWMLREAARSDAATGMGFAAPLPVARRVHARPWVLVAAVASAIIAGFAVGRGTYRDTRSASVSMNQPSPTAVAVATPAVAAFPVPAATRVIQLEFRSDGSSGGD
jgi:hypothetical protein